MGLEQGFQPAKGRTRADVGTQRTHQHVDGRQRPRHQHVGGDHRAGRHLAVDHQQGARAQRQRLLGVADELAPGRDALRQTLRLRTARQRLLVPGAPVRTQVVHHAHGLQQFRVAQLSVQIRVRLALRLHGFDRRRHRASVTEPGQHPLDQREDDCQETQPRVHDEQHRDVDRCPRRVEESEDALAGQELAQLGQVGKRAPGTGA